MTHPQKPRKKLKNLIIDRIDLCDKGANPDARVMLFKRDAPAGIPEGIAPEKLDDMKRRINNLFRNWEEKTMNVSEISKAIEAQQITTREQAWSAIGRLIDAEVGRELVRAFEEQRIARTREQLLAEIISNTAEGQKLWQAWQSLPDAPVTKVQKQEPIQPASWRKIERLAKSLVSEGKAQTIQEAVTQVATANPDLYREYRREI